MCELLGMNASVPTDIIYSLKALARRGSGDSPHRDGWGIAFYNGPDIQIFRDPACIADSVIANMLQQHPIRSETVIAHIRHANVGDVCLPNTHPFTRELWGQHWTFAHNGQLKDFSGKSKFYCPIGATDSEAVFCDLLSQIREQFPERAPYEMVTPFIAGICANYRGKGPLNCLLSNSEWLFAFCSTKLAFVTRECVSNPSEATTVISTEPLTHDEEWTRFNDGDWKVWRNGYQVASGQIA
jgi:glutamine amidotransferase